MSEHPLMSDLRLRYARLVRDPISIPESEPVNSISCLSDYVVDLSRTDALELRGVPLSGHGGVIRGTSPGDSSARLERDNRYLARGRRRR